MTGISDRKSAQAAAAAAAANKQNGIIGTNGGEDMEVEANDRERVSLCFLLSIFSVYPFDKVTA